MQRKSFINHVLIVDHKYSDELAIQKEHQSYNFIILPDFQNALNLINTNFIPKVIVCNIDLQCNFFTGLSFISNIRCNESWSCIPIIALSRQSHSDVILESLKRGAIDFMKCPYQPVELFKRIQHASNINRPQYCQEPLKIDNKNSQLKELRKMYVETMKYAVLYWETCTQKTKIDLAEASGLWSVYLDKNGSYRTRTLDRYLKEESLPKNTKVKQILLTANYVLNHCQKQSMIQQKLKHCFFKLLETEEMSSEDFIFLKN